VNGTQVIDNWTDHAPTENSGTIALLAGVAYPIQMDFYENGGGAVAGLSWSSASQPKQVIPQNRLCHDPASSSPTSTPTSASTDTPTATPTAVPTALPVAIDAVTTCTDGSSSSFTWAHTVGSGSNRLLLVGVSLSQFNSASVTSVTYGGQGLTRAAFAVNSGQTRSEVWRLVAPPVGTANVVVSLSATERTVCGATSWANVDQATPLGTAATASGNTTSGGGNQPSLAVSSAANQVVHDVLAVNSTNAVTVGGGQTQRWSESTGFSVRVRGAASTEPGAASTTMSWSGVPASTGWALVAVPIRQAQIVFRSASSNGAASGSLTISKPVGTLEDDVLVASISVRPNTPTISAPAGWILVRRVNNGNSNASSLAVYYKVAGASEPSSYTWTFSSSSGSAGGIAAFSGVDTSDPIDVENGQNTANSTSHASPSITTTIADAMVVTSHAFTSAASWTSPSGMIEACDDASVAVPNAGGISFQLNYVTQPSAGVTGAKTAVASNDADVGNTHVLVLRPAP
jgi:hypothetical protein